LWEKRAFYETQDIYRKEEINNEAKRSGWREEIIICKVLAWTQASSALWVWDGPK
jgi:hypothetical protein